MLVLCLCRILSFFGFLSLNVFFMCPLWAHNWLNKLSIYLILYPELISVERGTGARGTPLFSNFLFTNLFSIKFLHFFIISSLFPYFNLFVSIFIQSYVNIKLHVSTLLDTNNTQGMLLASSTFIAEVTYHCINFNYRVRNSNDGDHVWWGMGSSTIILKEYYIHVCIKFNCNIHRYMYNVDKGFFWIFFNWFFCWFYPYVLFIDMAAMMVVRQGHRT
jgi:hypothetical protein